MSIEKGRIVVLYEEREEREYPSPRPRVCSVDDGDYIHAGQQLTEGRSNPQDILRILGPEAVQLYLVEEVQKVYRSQGVNINDKHIEVIVRQMLRKVRVDQPGRHQPAARRAGRPLRVRGARPRASSPRAASRRRRSPCCSA